MSSVETRDTRLVHLDCHMKAGHLQSAVDFIGRPDSPLLSPCCRHGYRAVWGPRQPLRMEKALENVPFNRFASAAAGAGPFLTFDYSGRQREYRFRTDDPTAKLREIEHQWWESRDFRSPTGEELAQNPELYFGDAQTLLQGNWVLAQGVEFESTALLAQQYAGDGEIPNYGFSISPSQISEVDALYWSGFDVESVGNIAYEGWATDRMGSQDSGAAGVQRTVLGQYSWDGNLSRERGYVEWTDRDLSWNEAWYQQILDDVNNGVTDPDSVYWIQYGNRQFLGLTKCLDRLGTGEHVAHGDRTTWRVGGSQTNPKDWVYTAALDRLITPTSTARGGYEPKPVFFGGEVVGVSGKAVTNDDGDVTSIEITDPGLSVVTDMNDNMIDPPKVTINMPDHYTAFEATATISTDYEEIKALLPDLIKTKAEMESLLCDGYSDPIAQTFLVNGNRHPDGIFVESVDLCFSSKPLYGHNIPVYVEIRPTNNGYPDSEKVIAQKILYPNQVNTTSGFRPEDVENFDAMNSPSSINFNENSADVYMPSFETTGAFTKFKFDYPVYLEEAKEYAIVVRSNDSSYRCWIADTDQPKLRDDQSLADFEDDGYIKSSSTYGQQYGGSLFISQNGKTWTASQKQDLMFRVNKCNFTTSDGSFKLNGPFWKSRDEFEYDRIKLNTISYVNPDPSSCKITGTFKAKEASTGDLVTVPANPFGRDGAKTIDFGTRKKISKGSWSNSDPSLQIDIGISSTNPDVTPIIDNRIVYALPIQNRIDNGGLTANDITIVAPGTGYSAGASHKFIVSGGGSKTNAEFYATEVDTDGSLVYGITVSDSGSGFYKNDDTDPITITHPASGSGATFEILSDEGTDFGNSKMRYVTKPITLAPGMSARGLKTFITALQPFGSEIYVYYKVLAEEDSEDIERKRWKVMKRIFPDEDSFDDSKSGVSPSGYYGTRELSFESEPTITYTSDNGNSYNGFKTFAIKIVCHASNPSKPPIINNFRTIAAY